jgi:hypothetical protein
MVLFVCLFVCYLFIHEGNKRNKRIFSISFFFFFWVLFYSLRYKNTMRHFLKFKNFIFCFLLMKGGGKM